MLLTLTVTGRVALDPPDPLDARIGAAFNDHQRRDGLLGPDAVDRLPRRAIVRPSPWRLGAADAGLIAEWLDGWVAAACEQEPALASRRLPTVSGAWPGAELAVTVDHADVLVLPC